MESIIVQFDIANRAFKSLSIDELAINPQDKSKVYWVHCNLHDEGAFQQLINKLQLPERVISLCRQEDTLPQVIDADNELTLQIQCLLSTDLGKKKEEHFSNLVIHLTSQFCFTAALDLIPALITFNEEYPKAINYAQTSCFILFLILDDAVNDYAKALFTLEQKVDDMDLLIRRTPRNVYNEVMHTKKQLIIAKRYANAIREILMRISGRHIAVVSEQCRVSLSNLFTHSEMIVNEADFIRDILNGLLDQIDNSIMQRMSETMKVLTAFAAIFLPLSLITGIYGMNFYWMPELHWRYGYFWALSLIFTCGLVLLIIFKKRDWF